MLIQILWPGPAWGCPSKESATPLAPRSRRPLLMSPRASSSPRGSLHGMTGFSPPQTNSPVHYADPTNALFSSHIALSKSLTYHSKHDMCNPSPHLYPMGLWCIVISSGGQTMSWKVGSYWSRGLRVLRRLRRLAETHPFPRGILRRRLVQTAPRRRCSPRERSAVCGRAVCGSPPPWR